MKNVGVTVNWGIHKCEYISVQDKHMYINIYKLGRQRRIRKTKRPYFFGKSRNFVEKLFGGIWRKCFSHYLEMASLTTVINVLSHLDRIF